MSAFRSDHEEESCSGDDVIASATASNSPSLGSLHGSITTQEWEDRIKQFGAGSGDGGWDDTFEGILDLDDRPEGMLENGGIDSPAHTNTNSSAVSRTSSPANACPAGVANAWVECRPTRPTSSRSRMDDTQSAVGGAGECSRVYMSLPSSQQAMEEQEVAQTIATTSSIQIIARSDRLSSGERLRYREGVERPDDIHFMRTVIAHKKDWTGIKASMCSSLAENDLKAWYDALVSSSYARNERSRTRNWPPGPSRIGAGGWDGKKGPGATPWQQTSVPSSELEGGPSQGSDHTSSTGHEVNSISITPQPDLLRPDQTNPAHQQHDRQMTPAPPHQTEAGKQLEDTGVGPCCGVAASPYTASALSPLASLYSESWGHGVDGVEGAKEGGKEGGRKAAAEHAGEPRPSSQLDLADRRPVSPTTLHALQQRLVSTSTRQSAAVQLMVNGPDLVCRLGRLSAHSASSPNQVTAVKSKGRFIEQPPPRAPGRSAETALDFHARDGGRSAETRLHFHARDWSDPLPSASSPAATLATLVPGIVGGVRVRKRMRPSSPTRGGTQHYPALGNNESLSSQMPGMDEKWLDCGVQHHSQQHQRPSYLPQGQPQPPLPAPAHSLPPAPSSVVQTSPASLTSLLSSPKSGGGKHPPLNHHQRMRQTGQLQRGQQPELDFLNQAWGQGSGQPHLPRKESLGKRTLKSTLMTAGPSPRASQHNVPQQRPPEFQSFHNVNQAAAKLGRGRRGARVPGGGASFGSLRNSLGMMTPARRKM